MTKCMSFDRSFNGIYVGVSPWNLPSRWKPGFLFLGFEGRCVQWGVEGALIQCRMHAGCALHHVPERLHTPPQYTLKDACQNVKNIQTSRIVLTRFGDLSSVDFGVFAAISAHSETLPSVVLGYDDRTSGREMPRKCPKTWEKNCFYALFSFFRRKRQ